MHVEIVLAAVVLLVAVLVAADFFRRTSDTPHEYPEGPGHDAGRETYPAPRAGSASTLSSLPSLAPYEPAVASPAAGGRRDPAAGGRRDPAARTPSPPADPSGPRPNWLVRTRLCLLAVVCAAAAALATASVIRAAGAFQRASADSNVSSMHDGAIVSATLALVFAAAVLAVGVWSAMILIRSVLRPLHQLRTGAVELSEVWLPDALRTIGRAGGEGRPLAVKAVGVSALDEIGDVARAFDQVQGEVLRLADNEAGLRGKLSEMFTELSGRGQSLMEHQLRLIDELGQDELDAGRRASLATMNRLATRMRRYSQNLLVLAGQELPGRWNRPVMLVEVVRAAVAQTGEYDRVSVSVQPDIAVIGPAVNDVVHLIAELAENAVSLSAADTPVDMSGRPLTTGGVLVEVTDQGVGMNPEMMAQANWRLENPPPIDAAVSRNMGLFVVARLAARHGVKVRLQPAATGGVTALVWLPDAIVVLPEAGAAAGLGPAEPDVMAGPAPAPEDVRALESPPPGLPAGPGLRPRHARPALRLRALAQAQPLAQAHSPAQAQAPALTKAPASRRAFSWSEAAGRPRPAEVSRPATPDGPAPAGDDPRPQATGEQATLHPAEQRRLPIYEAVESDWFSSQGKPSGGGTGEVGWGTLADGGWEAAKTVLAPASDGVTTVGLPVRVPHANLVPGSAGRAQPGSAGRAQPGEAGSAQPDATRPARSAEAARNRLAGFQRGASRGRAAAGHGGPDETP